MKRTQILGKGPDLKSPDIHIAFGIDSKYLPALGACIHSIIRNNAGMQIQFHVITAALPHRDAEQLAAFAEQHSLAVQLHILGGRGSRISPRPSSAALAAQFTIGCGFVRFSTALQLAFCISMPISFALAT